MNDKTADRPPGSILRNLRDALAWRIRGSWDPLVERVADRSAIVAARAWRPFLRTPVFIGITGSAGKTTTKELLTAILAQRRRGLGTPGNENVLPFIARMILRMRPDHGFCVAELTEDKPGVMDEMLPLLRPSVGIVTVVRHDHASSYESPEGLAREMGKLAASLPECGTAVLNADDEQVLAMAAACRSKVITYGLSPNALLRAEDVEAAWPTRLKLTVVYGSERVRVNTQLCGAHFVPSVLGAIGGGLAAGLSLAECAEAIERVAPFTGRMQPVANNDGVTFIRDDFKAPLWTLDASLDFMRSARAARKIVVIGELSDTGAGKVQKYTKAASRALDCADIAVFAGPWASSAHKARRKGREDALRVFNQVYDAARHVNSIARAGDLIMLKGTNKQDHLVRVILARAGAVACWRDDCERGMFCDACPSKDRPSGVHMLLDRDSSPGESAPTALLPGVASRETIVIGLGNPDPKYAVTPHNVGHALVDRIAESHGLSWEEFADAWIARGTLEGHPVCLIKVRQVMNLIGGSLKQLAEAMAFRPEQCILAYDDLALPLGTVRPRMNGSAGGHRGVASILEAFQTDAFARVKIGVGKENAARDRIEYVLSPFDPADRALVEQSVAEAARRVCEMVAQRGKTLLPPRA